MQNDRERRPRVLVGKTVGVRVPGVEPSYFTGIHRAHVGATGVVHAIVPTEDRDDPLVKVKFGKADQIVFFRLADLDVQADAESAPAQRHGDRASHLPRA